MALYYTKDRLYNEIAKIKEFMGFYRNAYRFDLIDYCICTGNIVEFLSFKTPGLRGMAVVGQDNQPDIIMLNQNRSRCEQNFDCGHEVIHLCLHRNLGLNSFECLDNMIETRNSYLEWHANEGSAELFVPYQVFLPMIKEIIGNSSDYFLIEQAKIELANIFRVPEAVIHYRLENLKYEIYQYLNGIPLDNLRILSLTQQKQCGLEIPSLNDIARNDFMNKCCNSFCC